jgi:uncharacterized protein
MRQTWRRLLFAHWPVPTEPLAKLLPPGLTLDTFEGQAYIGVLPFHMTGVRVRPLPPIPGTTEMLQLNVRTYVRRGDKRAVYFLALDTNHLPTVLVSRLTLGLPYYFADMKFRHRLSHQQAAFELTSRRGASSQLHAIYRPYGEPFQAPAMSLEHWLVERYCLYTMHGGKLLRVDIHHHPWSLQLASATFLRQTVLRSTASQLGVELNPSLEPPLLHYAERMDALIWPPRFGPRANHP